ncbi:response regulator transcription factor [Fusibacter sp. 3D3]|uniref:response regulator transcription factor n=1 Tax=Fusibacter sp. 3D3 TaxID=1048380 RepID=UPI000852A66F|nr:response regulator transcription factor [Fusibacter sp. 3D3]GAU76281.1 DNA-binding response regulator [Fusibacter sp. 3D3]
MIKIAIVDDQKLIINGLSMMVNLQPDMEVLWTAEHGKEALFKITSAQPDLILMDIRMPEMNGVEATALIKRDYPDTKVLVLTTFNEDAYIFETLKAGASGYLLKDVPPEELLDGIRKAVKGGTVIEPSVASKVVKNLSRIDENVQNEIREKLTTREFEISKMISEGLSNKEISELLFLSEGTVKNHLTNALEKLELRDRTQLAILMLKNQM